MPSWSPSIFGCIQILRLTASAQLTNAQLDDAGDQEFRNWICLSGAMGGYKAEIVDYLETYIFNSNKCFAIFRPNSG